MKANNILKIGLTSICAAVLFSSCQQKEDIKPVSLDSKGVKSEVNNDKGTIPNKIIVKFKQPLNIESLNTRSGSVEDFPLLDLNSLSKDIQVAKISRLFPQDPRFVEREHKAGLDRWYVLTLKDTTSVATRSSLEHSLKELPGIELVSPVRKIKVVDNGRAVPVTLDNLTANDLYDGAGDSKLETVTAAPFNDRMLPGQWHYNCTGELRGSKRGADIDLYDAWKVTTGTPNVIVNVVDGGIDVQHEDLKQNLWVNQAELNGQPGVDDDNNGYIDDIYGYNFVDMSPNIVAHEHGTHVAGTVAAVNNNKIGVCGIAGGNGSPETGVRLMNSQIFRTIFPGQDKGTDFLAAAIKYGADNGAVISQNSWGFQEKTGITETPPDIKAAIDYFIKNAGCDAEGNQRPDSPMKGGVVIFAAGNDGNDHKQYPAVEPEVISVAAIAPNFKMAGYSSHGTWVSLCAPGGDVAMDPNVLLRAYQVLSTLPGSKYGYLDGTSMACPHVSGIAALAVSKYGGPGFTADMLKERILRSTHSIYYDNPDKKGLLGRGYIDASMAVSDNDNVAPAKVQSIKILNDTTALKLQWHTVKKNDTEFAFWYHICASKNPITSTEDAMTRPDVVRQTVRGPRGKDQDVWAHSARLEIGPEYHVVIVAEDKWGNKSEVSDEVVSTIKNGLPTINRKEPINDIRITGTETGIVQFEFSDPDKQELTLSLEGNSKSCELKRDGNSATIIVRTGNYKPGIYNVLFVVTDSMGGVKKYPFTFEVYKNNPPEPKKDIDVISLGFAEQRQILLDQYFYDRDGHNISYKLLDGGNSDIATVILRRNYLDITGFKEGKSNIKLQVSDTQNGVLEKNIEIVVNTNPLVYNIYPMQVTDYLNIALNHNLTGLARVSVYNTLGSKVIKLIVDTKNQKDIKLDMTHLSTGTYIVVIENGSRVEKVTISKK